MRSALILADMAHPLSTDEKTSRTRGLKLGSHLLSSEGPRLTMTSPEVKIWIRCRSDEKRGP